MFPFSSTISRLPDDSPAMPIAPTLWMFSTPRCTQPGTDGLGKAVVRVVLVIREDLLPTRDQMRRHGLRADVHEPPLRQPIIRQMDLPANQWRQGYPAPTAQAARRSCSLPPIRVCRIHSGFTPRENDRLAAPTRKLAEPVHFRACMVERRDAEEHVVLRLSVMRSAPCGRSRHQSSCAHGGSPLGKPGRSGGKIDRRVVVFRSIAMSGRYGPSSRCASILS